MDQQSINTFWLKLPDLIFSIANIGFLIQLRRMSVDGEKVKQLQNENESLTKQYTQLLAEKKHLEGENTAYKTIQAGGDE